MKKKHKNNGNEEKTPTRRDDDEFGGVALSDGVERKYSDGVVGGWSEML